MSRLWSVYTAAPHRVMFLPGVMQGVLVMLWWLLDMESRRAGGAGLAPGGMPGPALHVWWMLFGFFPFFVFGFLFTAAPNWLNGPAIPRAAYVSVGMLLPLGVALVYAGAFMRGGLPGNRVAFRGKLAGGVWQRRGRTRFPIFAPRSGVVIPDDMIEGASKAAFLSTAARVLPVRLAHELGRVMPGK